MKYKEYSGNIIDIYAGLYKNDIICISSNKKAVNHYMKYIRRLDKHQYDIEKRSIIESNLMYKYEDYIIEEFHGYYLPNIDINIINRDINSLNNLLEESSNNIKELLSLLNYTKNIKDEELVNLFNSLKIIEKYKHGKNNKKISKVYWKAHTIFFCDMSTYLNLREEYKNYKRMKSLY